MKSINDFIWVYMDYLQEQKACQWMMYKLMVIEVYEKFLLFLQDNSECINRYKCGLVGLEKQEIMKFIHTRIVQCKKNTNICKNKYDPHKRNLDFYKRQIFEGGKDARSNASIINKAQERFWVKQYKKKKSDKEIHVMNKTYFEIKKLAILVQIGFELRKMVRFGKKIGSKDEQ